MTDAVLECLKNLREHDFRSATEEVLEQLSLALESKIAEEKEHLDWLLRKERDSEGKEKLSWWGGKIANQEKWLEWLGCCVKEMKK